MRHREGKYTHKEHVTTTAFVPKDVVIQINLMLYRIFNEQTNMQERPVLFLFPHRTYVLDICEYRLTEAILTNIQNVCFFKVLNTIFLHNL